MTAGFKGNQKGAIALTFAIVLPLLLGFMSLGYDVAKWYLDRDNLQAATDAAAMELALEGTTNLPDSQLISAAKREMARNGFDAASKVTVKVYRPPTSGPNMSNLNAVELLTTLPAFSVFGFYYMADAFTINTRSVAGAQTATSTDPYPCILALLDSVYVNNQTVSTPGCSVVSNAVAENKNSSGNQDTIYLYPTAGNVLNFYTSGKILESSKAINHSTPHVEYGKPLADPYAATNIPDPYPAALCNSSAPAEQYLGKSFDPASTIKTDESHPLDIGVEVPAGTSPASKPQNIHTNLTVAGVDYVHFHPGVYCFNTNIGYNAGYDETVPRHIKFMPGVYSIKGSASGTTGQSYFSFEMWRNIIADATSTDGNNGVTFVLEDPEGIGHFQILNGISVSAPISGNYKGLAISFRGGNYANDYINNFILGGNMQIAGDVYAPNKLIRINGNINKDVNHCTRIIVGGFRYDGPGPMVLKSSCTKPDSGSSGSVPNGPKGLLE